MVNRIDFFAKLLNERGAKLGVEVGVANGYFSFPLLERWPGKLYLVDLWGETRDGQEHIPQTEQDRRYESVKKIAWSMDPQRAFPLRMNSVNAAGSFYDSVMDFIYLDADHSYEGVRDDIAAWWPKLKSGGTFSGHDFLHGVHGGVTYGVKQAVDEFATAQGLKVQIVEEEWPSWLILKP